MAIRPLAAEQTQRLAAGQEHHRAGRLAEAERAYREVLRVDPSHPVPLHMLAILASDSGHHREAIKFTAKALARDPDNPELHHRLAESYRLLGDDERAHRAYQRAIELRPGFVEAHVDCALAAEQAAERAGKAGDVPRQQRWRRIAGGQLARVGELHAAVRSGARAEIAFRRALELDPANADACWNFGNLLGQMARFSEAEPLFRQAIALEPRVARRYSSLAFVLRILGRPAESDALYRRALELDPCEPAAAHALSSGRLLELHYRSDLTAAQILAEHRRWGDDLIARQSEISADFPNEPDPERSLRIGYVSPDFRKHSVSYFLEPLLAHHDRSAVELTCYAEVAEPDAMTARFKSLARRWRSTVGMSDAELRRQVREDRIDVLIDLAGHTNATRIAAFAVKPAPVTASWLGYPDTTGLATVDYRFTDERADPTGESDGHHVEKLVRLPDGFLCYKPPAEAPPVGPTPALAKGTVTFGSFNYPEKVTPQVVETWAAILRGVSGARIVLKGWHFNDPVVRQRYLDQFAAAGVPAGCVELRPMIPGTADHMGLYGEIDIALDPFPYNGTTTTCEALWMGVPVVSLIGDRHVARVGLSLLAQVGLADLAAPDSAAYIRVASELARDIETLNALRLGLRDRMTTSTLMDAPRFARAFEGAVRGLWRTWCAGAKRQSPA